MGFAQAWNVMHAFFSSTIYLLSGRAKPAPPPDPAASPLGTLAAAPPPEERSGNERAKGQAAWVHPQSRGQGARRRGKGYAGLRRILNPESITNSVARIICLPPSWLIKLPCDPKNPAEQRQSGGRFQHISTSNNLTSGRLTGRRGFLSSGKVEMGRKIPPPEYFSIKDEIHLICNLNIWIFDMTRKERHHLGWPLLLQLQFILSGTES